MVLSVVFCLEMKPNDVSVKVVLIKMCHEYFYSCVVSFEFECLRSALHVLFTDKINSKNAIQEFILETSEQNEEEDFRLVTRVG